MRRKVAGQQVSVPRTRGWSQHQRVTESHRHVGPAHAGMVLSMRVPRPELSSRSRARGDGPGWPSGSCALMASVPRTRGWSVKPSPSAIPDAVGPAHAGMVLDLAELVLVDHRRSRARGDGPRFTVRRRAARRSVPRTRGWSWSSFRVPVAAGVGPAHAGMVRGTDRFCPRSSSRSRARGDGPHRRPASAPNTLSVPRTRGWSLRARWRPVRSVVGPAHAGMVLLVMPVLSDVLSRSRARGDGPHGHRG